MRPNQIKAYLRLLCLDQELPSLSYLRKLQRRHIETIPHENVNAIYNFPTSFNLDHLLKKYKEENRGGMCFELNYSFCALLKELGFEARLVLCEVNAYELNQENNAYPTHPIIVVEIDGSSCLVDAGWCDSYREPLSLKGEIYKDHSGMYRVLEKNTHEFTMQKWLSENKGEANDYKWHDQFSFTYNREEAYVKTFPSIFLAANAYTHCAPKYLFSWKFKFTRVTPNGHLSLWDDVVFNRVNEEKSRKVLTVSRPDFLKNDLHLLKRIADHCKKLKRTVSMTFFEARIKNDLLQLAKNNKRVPSIFNLDNYLFKIKAKKLLLGSLSYDDQLFYLNEIFLAHVKTIPFQNFELLKISRQHPVSRESLLFETFPKIMTVQNGGFCFQTSALLYTALKRLGFDAHCSLAKVLAGREVGSPEALDLPETHLIVVIKINQQRYLLDPGLVSSGKRSAFLITEEGEPVQEGSYQFKLSRHPNFQDLFVFQAFRNEKWFTVLQSRLSESTLVQCQEKLCHLERFPKPLRVRDSLIVVYIATNLGFKTFSWDAQQERLIYTIEENGVPQKMALESFSEGCEVLSKEFGITHISEGTLKSYCSNLCLPRPKKAWTVDFPLDENELNQMSENLSRRQLQP